MKERGKVVLYCGIESVHTGGVVPLPGPFVEPSKTFRGFCDFFA